MENYKNRKIRKTEDSVEEAEESDKTEWQAQEVWGLGKIPRSTAEMELESCLSGLVKALIRASDSQKHHPLSLSVWNAN